MSSSIIPCLRYRDAPAMIDWLCRTFGFVRHAVHSSDDGTIAHAQLTLDGGMVMLGSVEKQAGEWERHTLHPDETGGRETQSPYLVVADADAVYARAKAAGARIVIEIQDEDYGGRGFTCVDPEGHMWSAGTYDPWQGNLQAVR